MEEPVTMFTEALMLSVRMSSSKDDSLLKDVYVVCNDEAGNGIKLVREIISRDNRFKEQNMLQEEDNKANEEEIIADEDCCICMDTCTKPKKLKCGHIFCTDCIEQYFQMCKPACPQCGAVFGKVYGDQPNGKMYISKDRRDLPGYGGCGSITVTYDIPTGVQGVSELLCFLTLNDISNMC